jgi:osmotically-inducible protein OsmY
MQTLEAVAAQDLDIVNRDDDLARRVKLYLAAVRAELGKVKVRANSGTIHLAGRVRTFYARQLAISAAMRVAGVQHVIDDIDVPVLACE